MRNETTQMPWDTYDNMHVIIFYYLFNLHKTNLNVQRHSNIGLYNKKKIRAQQNINNPKRNVTKAPFYKIQKLPK